VDAAQVDDAGRALGAVAVDAVVRREEVPVERRERVGGIGSKRDLEMVGLPDVADIGEVEDVRMGGRHALAPHQPGAGQVAVGERPFHRRPVEPRKRPGKGHGALVFDRGEEQAGRRQHAGMGWHGDPPETELAKWPSELRWEVEVVDSAATSRGTASASARIADH